MNKTLIKKMLSPFVKMKYRVKSEGTLYIGKNTRIKKPKNLLLGKNINICSNSIIVCGNKIKFGDNSYIGFFTEIMCIHGIEIGKNVICGPYMFITDSNHEYRDVNKPISQQGAPENEKVNRILIEDDCWIGAHVSIVGNVKIGKHSVVAAGSVVNKDVPPFSVVCGVSARVLKKYNFETREWEKVK